MPRRFSFVFLLWIWASLIGPAWSQDTTLALPLVTVTATRAPLDLPDAAVRITVLDSQAIAASGSRTVAELLTARSGAFVRRYGAGGLATVSFRGTGASQTLVLIDGHRISDPQLGQLDFSLLPTALLTSAELLHGSGSALYGSDGIGGVLNLRLRTPDTNRLHGTVYTGRGAYDARSAGGSLSIGREHLSGLFAVDYEAADGDFPYLNSVLFPPQTVRRIGADREQISLYGTVGHDGARHRTRVSGWYSDAERGLPGPGTRPLQDERQWDRHLRFWLNHETQLPYGILRIGGLVQDGHLRYLNPRLGVDDTGETRIGSLDAELRQAIGDRHLVSAGVTGSFGTASHPALRAEARERHLGAFLNATGSYRRWLVYPALRVDHYRLPETSTQTALSPQLGLNLHPLPSERFRLKASLGRSFRVPTFNQRFWRSAGATGNPDIQPEHGWSTDLGAMWISPVQHVEVNVFHSRVRDQIVWQSTGRLWRPENVQQVWTRGLEASYHFRQTIGDQSRVEAGLRYTWTDARDRSDPTLASFDQPLRYVPHHQVKAFAGARWRMVALDFSGQRTSARPVTTDGRQTLDAYTVLQGGLRLMHTVRGVSGTLSLVVENLLDARYAVINDYPMPPRHGRIQLNLTL